MVAIILPMNLQQTHLFMPGKFPQKYRALRAGDISFASTTTGLHCKQNWTYHNIERSRKETIIHATQQRNVKIKIQWTNIYN